jgi:hypothetical protein
MEFVELVVLHLAKYATLMEFVELMVFSLLKKAKNVLLLSQEISYI